MAISVIMLIGGRLLAGSGTHAGDFLNIPIYSRGAALGNTSVSSASGTSALFYNPAAIALNGSSELSLSHSELLQDLRLDNVSLAVPLKSGGFGIGVTYLGYGSIEGYDVAGVATGNLSAYSLLVSVGYSQKLSDVLSLGAAAKPVIERLADHSAKTITFDAGVMAQFGHLALGAQYANFGGALKYIEESISLPATLRLGASYRTLGSSTFSVAGSRTAGEGFALGGGLEYQYNSALAIRAGYSGHLEDNSGSTEGLSLGAGLFLGQMSLDYSYRPTASQEGLHQITASYRFVR